MNLPLRILVFVGRWTIRIILDVTVLIIILVSYMHYKDRKWQHDVQACMDRNASYDEGQSDAVKQLDEQEYGLTCRHNPDFDMRKP